MKDRIRAWLRKNRAAMESRTAKLGGYSAVLTVLVLAILIAVNVFVGSLPAKFTQFDISAERLYTLTSSTKSVVSNLDRDVTVYWIVQSGKEDSVLERLLDIYDGLSDHLTVVKKNPDIYPTFAKQYTDETVTNNSLVVESGDRYRYVPYSDIYQYDTSSYYYTGSVSQTYDGEGAITAAVDYVVTDELPQVLLLTGHGEIELSDTASEALEKANMETQDFSLLNTDEIPEDADCILINAPTSDISEEEADMLRSYLASGGKVLLLSGPQEENSLDNLYSVFTDYGITAEKGIVVEGDRSSYAFSAPYVLLPELEEDDVTEELISNRSNVIIPIAQGLTEGTASQYVTTTSLLTTSDSSFSKLAGFSLTTYEMEDGDIAGPFSLAVRAEESLTGAELVWVSTDYLLDDSYNSYSSGANIDFAMNILSDLVGDADAISIRSKSLDYSYLEISEEQGTLLKAILIGIVPAIVLLAGIDEVLRRRKLA